MLTNGIKTGEYDAVILSINADTDGARINFEKGQLRLLEFKSLIDDGKRNQRNVSSVEGRGTMSRQIFMMTTASTILRTRKR